MRTKIKNIVNDLHWKVAHFLCKNFETIILPRFEVKGMTYKTKNINSETTRKMLTLSHYKFKERLIHKAKMWNRRLLIVSEAFTSKTCGHCGTINEKLGSNKTFKCNNCDLIVDRDINGARNVIIRTCGNKKME